MSNITFYTYKGVVSIKDYYINKIPGM